MAWKLLVNSVNQTANIWQPFVTQISHISDSGVGQTPTITLSLNNRSQAAFTCLPGYVPNRNDVVQIYAQDGVTLLFGGIVIQRNAIGFGHYGSNNFRTDVVCGDYMTYADWCYSSHSYASSTPTLKQVLQDLVTDCLGAYGIALSGSQVTGPTLASFSFSQTSVSDALRQLSSTTGYVATIDASGNLSMFVPGTSAAPVSITTAVPNCVRFEWQDSNYVAANKVILACGPSGTSAYNQSWTQAGSATAWQADIPEAAGAANPFLVGVGVGVLRTVTLYPDTSGDYYWDRRTSPPTLRLGTDPVPSNGTVLTITYTAQYPFIVTAASGATPVIETLASDATVSTLAAGQAEVNGILASLNQDAIVATIDSLTVGWLPGQLLTVNLPARNVNTTFTVQDVTIKLLTDATWIYSFTATQSTTYQGNPVDQLRALIGGGSSGVSISLSGGGGGSSSGGLGGSGTSGTLAIWSGVSILSAGPTFPTIGAGSLLYASSSTALAALPIVAAGSVLVSGTNPAWSTSPSLTALTLSGALAANSSAITTTFSCGTVSSNLVPTTTDTYNIGSPTLLWKEMWISTLSAIVFSLTTQTIFGGYSTIGKNGGALNAATTIGGTTVDFGQTMTVNDFILIRAHDTSSIIRSEYMQIVSLVSGTLYNVHRDLANTNPTNQGWAFAAGTPWLDLGYNGTGRVDLLAFDGKPRMIIATIGTAYNSESDRVVVGNLNTYFGYSSDIYGFAAGDNANAWVKIDATNGVRLGNNTTTYVTIAPGSSPDIVLGLSSAFAGISTYKFMPPAGSGGNAIDRYGCSGFGSGNDRTVGLFNWAYPSAAANQTARITFDCVGYTSGGVAGPDVSIGLVSTGGGSGTLALAANNTISLSTTSGSITIQASTNTLTIPTSGAISVNGTFEAVTYKYGTAELTAVTGTGANMAASNFPGTNPTIEGWIAVTLSSGTTGYLPVWT